VNSFGVRDEVGGVGIRDGVDGFGVRDKAGGFGKRDEVDDSGTRDAANDPGVEDITPNRSTVASFSAVVAEVGTPSLTGLKRAQSSVARGVC